MAIIKTLQEDDGKLIYPNTLTKAVYSQDGIPLDNILSGVLGDTLDYHGPNLLSMLSNLSNPNLLINGGFIINSRGEQTYSGSSDSKWSVDAWKLGTYSVKLTRNRPGRGIRLTDVCNPNVHDTLLYTAIPDVQQYAGYDITVSMKFKSRTNFGGIGLSVGNDLHTEYSGVTKEVDGVITVTRHITKDDTDVIVSIYKDCKYDTDLDIVWVKAEVGIVPTNYIPKPVNEELMECYRLYEVIDQPVEAIIDETATKISFILPRKSSNIFGAIIHVSTENITEGVISVPNMELTMGMEQLLQGVEEPYVTTVDWTDTRLVYTIDINKTTLSRDIAERRMLIYGVKFIVESEF